LTKRCPCSKSKNREGSHAGWRAGDGAGRIAFARFFTENLSVQAESLDRTVIEGGASVTGADAALA
jgi:hypothetical protein